MYYIIDRFEEEYAVCENSETGEMENIEKTKIPNDVKRGDVLVLIDGEYILDIYKTEERKRIINNKIKDLWKK